ncbi:MAG: extracellular solute-binding protein, partial [Delftia sp.]|nr:extracellular solute-binding protein [Delftia sp.]
GKLWALPAEVDVQVLYYNKDIFDRENVPYPRAGWKWDDFLQTAQLLTNVQGQGPERSGHFGLASEPLPDVVSFIYQHGGQPLDFDDLLTEEALQWYADLSLKHGVMPQADDRWPAQWGTYGLFAVQKAAMMLGFLVQHPDRSNAQWHFEWGVAPLPGDQTEAAYTYPGIGYYISAHSPHPQEAWEWIQFLTLHPLGVAIPARRSVAQQEFRELVGDEVANTALYALEHTTPPIDFGSVPQEALDDYASLIESVVQGEITAAEAMSTLRDLSQE